MKALGRLGLPAFAGLVAATVALGMAELASGLLKVRSSVIAVGDGVIDLVPPPIKDFAIATFGTYDKLALLVGIFVMLVIFAAVVGIVARHHLRIGLAVLSIFGVVGVMAGVASPDPLPQAIIPPLVAVVAGGIALVLLVRRLVTTPGVDGSREPASAVPEEETPNEPRSASAGGFSRRGFLILSGKLGALALVAGAGGRWLTAQLSAAASRAAVVLPEPFRRAAPVPAAADFRVAGLAPFVTPNPTFYRIDTALVVPQVDAQTWSLEVKGMVDNPVTITFDELLAMPMVEQFVTLTCVSNVVGGSLVGNARWLGVPLADVLDQAGVDPQKATQIVGRSVDGWTSGFPTTAAYDGRPALVAVGMNGEPLPLEHGFPARLVVAGLYGYVSATKWLSEIELTTMESFDAYWVRRNWGKEGPIKTQSRIDVPRGFARVPAGRSVIAGVAWAQTRGVQKVEVQVDDGPWDEARLGAEVTNATWRQWVHEWDASAGSHTITVRATDGTGNIQTPVRADPIPNGAQGWHSVVVTVV